MKQKVFIVMLLCCVQTMAQKIEVNEFSVIDKKALQLPISAAESTDKIIEYFTANFKNENEKVRAIFIWVATNIEYDIANMFTINFYEKKTEKVLKPLRTGKGICENYAELTNELLVKSGLKSYVIEGYTKQNGFADYMPHAWCAVFIKGSWFILDPTWGSGYVKNGKFYKKINNAYFKVFPSTIIKTHIPFDYLWQFLEYPISNQAFYEGRITGDKSKTLFNYNDSIKQFDAQNETERLIASAYRIEKNGIKNAMIFDRLRNIKLAIENININIRNEQQSKTTLLYNAAALDYNNAVANLNAFIEYRNKQFVPVKSDTEIKTMIDTAEKILSFSELNLSKVDHPDEGTTLLINQLNKSINDIRMRIKEEQDWLKLYLSKSKSKRKSMFYERKITLFGKPVN